MALGFAALFSLKPWDTTSVIPDLRVSPGIGIALDDSVAVAEPARPLQVADARVVGAGPSTLAVGRATGHESGSVPTLAISPRRAVLVAPAPVRQRPQKPSSPPPEPVAVPIEQTAVTEPVAAPAPAPAPEPPAGPRLVANFENGLTGWSPAMTSDVTPRIVTGIVRDGSKSSVVRLSGDQSSSQLILGGDGGATGDGVIQIREGDEYAFAFSFYIQTMVYGEPGADNLILRFKSDASESESFGLQLWKYAGVPWQTPGGGLWSSGEAVGGDRFLAPVPERVWHDVIVHFKASSQGAGFYTVYLDEQPIDVRGDISMIAPGSSYAQIEVGLFRDSEHVQGTSEIRIDAAKFGKTLESVLPQ